MKTDRAFTFIELLIAFTIFSIIAASMYCTLNAGIKVWTRGNEIIRENQGMRIFFDTVNQDLKNAVSYSGFDSEWGAERIIFPTIKNVYKGGRMGREFVKTVYYFKDGEVIRVSATKGDGFNEELVEDEKKNILLDDVDSINFEYCYEVEGLEGEYEWKDVWEFEDETPIPRGIRVKLTLLGDGDRKEIFEKIVFIPLGILGGEE